MELEDTVKLMESNNYKKRFIGEYLQLKIRYEKLGKFIGKIELYNMMIENGEIPTMDKPVHDCPLGLLHCQLSVMASYMDLLKLRATVEGVELKEYE